MFWKCQILYHVVLVCLLILMPARCCLLLLFSCFHFYFSTLSNRLFLLSVIVTPQSNIGDASNAIQSIGPIIFTSVLTSCVHTTASGKWAFYLVSVWRLFLFLCLKHLDVASTFFFTSRRDTRAQCLCEGCKWKRGLSSSSLILRWHIHRPPTVRWISAW